MIAVQVWRQVFSRGLLGYPTVSSSTVVLAISAVSGIVLYFGLWPDGNDTIWIVGLSALFLLTASYALEGSRQRRQARSETQVEVAVSQRNNPSD